MLEHGWQNWVKYGPLTGLYIHARRIKRRLGRQPNHDIERFNPAPLDAGTLREQIALYPGNGRLYYSLALAYLEPILSNVTRSVNAGINDKPGDAESERSKSNVSTSEIYALACLRCAAACKLEAVERIQLYRAVIDARRGEVEDAVRSAEALEPAELTSPESILREQILRSLIPGISEQVIVIAPQWESTRLRVSAMNPSSLMIVGDDLAISAIWSKESDYLLVSNKVTGLHLESVCQIRKIFAVGVASTTDQQRAMDFGVRCEQWVTIPATAGGEV